MARTPTLPPDHPGMWRRLVARTHPDAGGDHELFIWTGAVRDVVCGLSLRAGASPKAEDNPSRRREPSASEELARVPFDPSADFAALTARALAMAEEVGGVHGALLELLFDCEAPPSTTGAGEAEQRGASYKKLAAMGHMVGMTKAERGRWYRVAEAVPLSDRHAGHILGRLKRKAA
ncbi:MAG: hypothetical protein M3R38_17660 [Actinomycetota bacterium]|nr:hypothetical protein [Actinomycetota bacterium]